MERSRAATGVATALFLLIFFPHAKCSSVAQVRQMGPRLVVEPPSVVQYWSEAGARLTCAAQGDPPPTVTWLDHDGTPLDDRPTVRRVFSNGTLEIIPWSGSRTRPQTQTQTLRCRAANAHGVVHSRDVTLEAVSEANWEVSLTAPAVAEGGVAALVCASPQSALVRPALWYRGDKVLHADSSTLDSRYLIADSALLIRDATAADAGAYSCLARHSLTAHTKRSRPSHLAVISGLQNSAPRLAPTPSELSVPSGSDLCLPCVASEHPTPHYTWYREAGGRLQPVEPSASVRLWADGAAACLVRATRRANGSWLCKAYNAYGDATNQLRVQVRDTLTVTVTPPVVVADTGSAVRFKCTVNDPTASVSWLHDGGSAGASAEGGSGELIVRAVGRAHRGMYQCFARRGRDTAQAAAELRLGDSGAELHYTFIEQALRPGGPVSLRCAASGSPAPTFSWLLDGQPLDHYLPPHRYSIHEETSPSGEVVSVLNISAPTTAADGGRYSCRAQNARGHALHSARLNIYGAPSIRAPGPVRVVAGTNATVHCPYAGYPISAISWWWRGSERVGAVGAGGRVSARGAELRLAPALATDAGLYACAVTAPDNTLAKRDIEIQVRNPPKISPFIFSTELTEGSSVQVLCGVSSGDKPMYFSWLKDGAPLPASLQIEEKSLNEFSLLMFSELTARHSGEYTCRVSNHAATVNYTAPLSVKVAPAWTIEPSDTAVLLGAPLLLECAAKGYPVPTIKWYKRIGEGAANAQEGGEHWEEIGGGEWGSGTTLKAHNDSLAASAASRHHQGVYRCKADNLVGPPLVKVINVTVHEPAHFDTSNGGERNVSCVRGRSASLACSALGDMPLTVHWTHRGNRIDLNSYRSTVSEVRTADGLRSVFQLRAAERVDAGEYRCHARNQHGTSELIMYLRVEEPPEAPRRVRLGGVGSRWVRLVWQIAPVQDVHFAALYTALHSLPGADTKHNTVNLTLESSGQERDGYQTFSARLDSLRPAVAYSLRLAAGNHVGRSPQSDPLIFTTLEEAPTGSPLNVHVRPASPGELHVTWSAPVRDTWNGELLGYAVSWRELGRFDDAEETEGRRSGTMTSPGWSSAETTLGGLRAFSRYAITLRAYNRAGAGPPSPSVFATTADGAPEESPTGVRCEPVSARSVRVRWASPRGAHAHALRGYDLHYAPLHYSHSWTGPTQSEIARAGPGGDATLQGLHTATNYSIFVRVRTDAGVGPPSSAVYCATLEDVPGATEFVRALAAGPDAVRVSWLAPSQRGGVLTHYTLYTRELGKVGGEWSQRVDVGSSKDGSVEGEEDEVFREVRGLRERTVYEFWVRAATAAGAGAPSRPVTAAPTYLVSARIASFGRVVRARRGARVRLRCSAVGAPPLRRRWVPLPNSHTVTDDGDLIIHNAEKQSAGNYTCSVRNGAGADSTSFALVVWLPPLAPAPRLVRAEMYALHLAWDAPPDGGSPLLGYSVWWSRESAGAEGGSGEPRSARIAPGDNAYSLSGLACGSLYRVTVRAHNAVGASTHSRPLLVRTRGDKAKAAPGKDFVWANSTTLRLNLLAWSGRCPVDAWTVALRLSAGGVWRDLVNNGETAEANDLQSGTWYEIRVVAHSPAGETVAQYKAATHTHNGERVGEPMELPAEPRPRAADGAVEVSQWRAGLAPALAGGGLAALLAALAAFALVRRRGAAVCLRRDCSLPQLRRPHPQLYSTEPSKRNAKTLSPHDGDLHEISPYATFSMAGGGAAEESVPRAESACALHLRTFGRAEHLDLGAPPNRPNLLRHSSEYGRAGGLRDSDSESSGSPCAACAAELYRLPAAHLSDTMPAVECSAEDTSSYSACGVPPVGPANIPLAGRTGAARNPNRAPQRRRRDTRHSSGPTVRYKAVGTALGVSAFQRQEAL